MLTNLRSLLLFWRKIRPYRFTSHILVILSVKGVPNMMMYLNMENHFLTFRKHIIFTWIMPISSIFFGRNYYQSSASALIGKIKDKLMIYTVILWLIVKWFCVNLSVKL